MRSIAARPNGSWLEATSRFRQGIRDTIDWYKANAAWVNRIKTGDYLKYYEEQYGHARRAD